MGYLSLIDTIDFLTERVAQMVLVRYREGRSDVVTLDQERVANGAPIFDWGMGQ